MIIPPFRVADPATGGYEVANAAYFNGSAKLTRTFSTAGDQRKFTISVWLNTGSNGGNSFFSAASGVSAFTDLRLDTNGSIITFLDDRVTPSGLVSPSAFYRDTGRHNVIYSQDTDQAVAEDRQKLFVNGQRVTDFSNNSFISQNTDTFFMSNVLHQIGERADSGALDYTGGMAQHCVLDGVYIDEVTNTPELFGRFNPDHGEWEPINITGLDYSGTNSFLLDFADSGNLGADVSGNGNNFTNSGVTQAISTPTDTYTTLNPLATSSVASLSNANLTVTRNTGTTNTTCTFSTIPFTGKVAFAFTGTFSSQGLYPGIATASAASLVGGGNLFTNDTLIWFFNQIYVDGVLDSSPGAWTSGVQCQLALDTDTGSVWIHNGTSWLGGGDPVTGTSPTATVTAGESWVVAVAGSNNGTTGDSITYDFGPNGYTPPEGFSLMSTASLPDPSDTITSGTVGSAGDFQYTGGSLTSVTFGGTTYTKGSTSEINFYSNGFTTSTVTGAWTAVIETPASGNPNGEIN